MLFLAFEQKFQLLKYSPLFGMQPPPPPYMVCNPPYTVCKPPIRCATPLFGMQPPYMVCNSQLLSHGTITLKTSS